MTLFVRKVNLKKWIEKEPFTQLDDEDIEADPMEDLATSQNNLSIYVVQDEIEARRAVATVAITLTDTKHVGYAILSLDSLKKLGFEIGDETGGTIDKVVNSWHKNIVKLSAKQIINLVKILRDHVQYFNPHDLAQTYFDGIQKGVLKIEDIKDKKIQKLIQDIQKNENSKLDSDPKR